RRYLKRIIGLPGDRITCAGGAVFRNGERLVEGYLAPDTVTECAPVTVPDGAVYALGDNRFFSKDSRHQGTIDGDRVTGRLITTFRLPFGQGPPAPASPASR
ncbi:MAG TPA: signal peptidase I, partial [Micromonosporaceae bacterium]|nr:signal peptidase I [Micromonosporaceae bacterium]